jgi:hypothetical protein
MTDTKKGDLHGGTEDNIGISPSVKDSSAEKNNKAPASEAGKIITKPEQSKKN